MAEKVYDIWLEKFNRDIGIKNSIVLSGNITDIMCNPNNGGKFESVLKNLVSTLKSKDYSKIIVWDRVEGIDKSLSSNVPVSDIQNTPKNTAPNVTAYDMGDDEEFSSTKDSIPSYAGDVESFFSFMLETLKSDSGKNVFILDYSDYLFGNANALSEQERANLLKLNKALQVQEYNLANQDFFENGNLLIILAKNQSTIPPEYYLNNPMVSTI